VDAEDLFVWALRSRRIVTICLNFASQNFLTYFTYLLTLNIADYCTKLLNTDILNTDSASIVLLSAPE